MKDWSNDIVSYEKNLRALRATGRPVAMLSSFTMSLMASFLLGADGCISGMGSVTADLQAELFAAVGKGDLDGAHGQRRLAPLVHVFYAPPFVDMHNRMKEALVHPRTHPRRPRPAAAHPGIGRRAPPDPAGADGVRDCSELGQVTPRPSARARTVGTGTWRRGANVDARSASSFDPVLAGPSPPMT